MDDKTIRIIPFTGENEQCSMWLEKFIAIAGIKRYDVLITVDNGIWRRHLKNIYFELMLINNKDYNDTILAQAGMVCFQITEESKKKDNKYGESRKSYMKLSRNIRSKHRDFQDNTMQEIC